MLCFILRDGRIAMVEVSPKKTAYQEEIAAEHALTAAAATARLDGLRSGTWKEKCTKAPRRAPPHRINWRPLCLDRLAGRLCRQSGIFRNFFGDDRELGQPVRAE
jgi:hypothetical protein